MEEEYGLTAGELLDAMNRRFRAKVTLEGAVAEVHLGKHIRDLQQHGIIARFEEHDQDAYPDYTIWLPGAPGTGHRIECKNIRDRDEAYRAGGRIVAYKVETQKTRASQADPSSRFYSVDQFEILAVCLGKKTHDWRQFMCIQSNKLARHASYPDKIAVMHRVPLPSSEPTRPWYDSLEDIVRELTNE